MLKAFLCRIMANASLFLLPHTASLLSKPYQPFENICHSVLLSCGLTRPQWLNASQCPKRFNTICPPAHLPHYSPDLTSYHVPRAHSAQTRWPPCGSPNALACSYLKAFALDILCLDFPPHTTLAMLSTFQRKLAC